MVDGAATPALDLYIAVYGLPSSPEQKGLTAPATDVFQTHFCTFRESVTMALLAKASRVRCYPMVHLTGLDANLWPVVWSVRALRPPGNYGLTKGIISMRGIIGSQPLTITSSGVHSNEPTVRPDLLRFWTLYWDQIDLPTNAFFEIAGDSDDETELEKAGIVIRSRVSSLGGSAGEIYVGMFLKCLSDHERRSPGSWALGPGPGSMEFKQFEITTARDLHVRLVNCVPVPAPETPIDRVIAFRERHQAEREAFMALIDELYLDIVRTPDPDKPIAERAAFTRLEKGIEDTLKAARSANSIKDFVSFDINCRFDLPSAIGAAALTFPIAGLAAAATAGMGAGIRVTAGPKFALKLDNSKRKSPFEYVGYVRGRLEWK